MTLLAIDTSTDYLSLALEQQDGAPMVFHEQVGQRHAELLLPTLQSLLDEAGMQLADLDAIVYGQGPGSFTGLRVGAGVAQGLALAQDIPLIPIPTLDNVAAQVPGRKQVLVCLDARMQQVYVAQYNTENGAERLSEITVDDPQNLSLETDGWVVAGSGLAVYPDQFSAAFLARLDDEQYLTVRPHATTYLALAHSGRYPRVDAAAAELLYIRNKVALTALEQKARST